MNQNLAYKALDYAEKAGAHEAEVYFVEGRSISIDIRKDTIELAKESLVSGIGIRAIVNGAIGFSSTNDPSRIEDASLLAVKSARVRGRDEQWSGLPEKSTPANIKGIFDRNIAELSIEDCIDKSIEMIKGAKSVPSVVPTSGNVSCSTSTHLIINTNGVEVEESHTFIQASIDTITKTSPPATASEFDVSREMNIDFYKIGEKASILASRSQKGVGVETKDTIVLLEPPAFADILESTFVPSINSDNVQKGRSSLIGKMGLKIASESLSIIDDGTLAGGIGTSSTDDEGTPSRRTEVIKEGVLSSFLYNCYTAGKENRESTGNGVRNSFASLPTIGIRNLIVEYPHMDVIAETKSGVIINTVIGAHTANPISGDFSVEARNSFMIEDGEITSPIKSMMISGNIFHMLQHIDGAGKDVRKVGNVVTPTIRVSKMRIIG